MLPIIGSMTRKYHNQTWHTYPWHLEEEAQNTKSQDSRKTIKVKQPALFDFARWLQKQERTLSTAQQN